MTSDRTPRLYVEADLAAGSDVALNRSQSHYLLNVMRLTAAGEVCVFNGRHGEWRAEVRRSGRNATLVATAQTRSQPEPATLALMFAPLRQARQDYAVQKAVELGVGRLLPVLCDYGQVRRVNPERMRANALEAAEQCGLLAVPEISRLTPLGEVVAGWCDEGGAVIHCDEATPDTDPATVLAGLKDAGPYAVLIGPEGGFSPAEREMLRAANGVTPLPLGPRIMRADTAAVAALALVQAILGDWRGEAPRWGRAEAP